MKKIFLITILIFYPQTMVIAELNLQIGVLIPRTGELRSIGANFLRGLRLGVENPVIIRVFDTEGRIRKTRRILQYLRSQNIDLIVGPLTSREVYGVLDYLSGLQIPVYSPLAYLPQQCNLENLFGPIREICSKVNYITTFLEKINISNGLVLYSETPEHVALSLSLRESLRKEKLVENWDFLTFDEKNFSYNFLEGYIDSTKPDILLLQGGGVATLGIINYIRYLGYRGIVISLEDLSNDSTIIRGIKSDTIYFLAYPTNEPMRFNRLDRFQREYKEKFNEIPDFTAVRGFETGILIDTLYTLYMLGNTDIWKILKGLKSLKGIKGEYLISGGSDFMFYVVTDGEIKEAKPDEIRK